MNIKYWKFVVLLICFYSSNIFEISKYIKINFLESYKLRNLLDEKTNLDKSARKGEDLKSIETCENSDYKYFFHYITGRDVIFDRNIDKSRAVSNHILIIIYIFYRILSLKLLKGKKLNQIILKK